MIDITQIERIAGAEVRGPDDDKIGSAGRVYVNDTTGVPSWVTVSTGLFGSRESFVPVQDATWDGEILRVPYDKEQVKNAPTRNPDGHLSVEEEQELYGHYGVQVAADQEVVPPGYEGAGDLVVEEALETADDPQTMAADPVVDPSADDAMTRSEEHLEVSTEQHEAGRARLRKYVVTEEQTVTVPVSHEEVRVEREPITDANRESALDGVPITEAEHEVVLHEERVVVSTQAEPVERFRLSTETVTEQETVTGEVRKEQIEVEGDGGADGAGDQPGADRPS